MAQMFKSLLRIEQNLRGRSNNSDGKIAEANGKIAEESMRLDETNDLLNDTSEGLMEVFEEGTMSQERIADLELGLEEVYEIISGGE